MEQNAPPAQSPQDNNGRNLGRFFEQGRKSERLFERAGEFQYKTSKGTNPQKSRKSAHFAGLNLKPPITNRNIVAQNVNARVTENHKTKSTQKNITYKTLKKNVNIAGGNL